jgi:hypothetical protein
MFPQFGATPGWTNAPFNGITNPNGSPVDLLDNFDLFSGGLFNNRTNVPASMAKYGDAGPMGKYGDRGPVRPEKPKELSTMELILQRLQQGNSQTQQPAAGMQPRFISQQAPGSLGGFYYNGVLRPSNWVPPSAEEMKDPQWEQKRDMALRASNSQRYQSEMPSEELMARHARNLAARQQYDRTDGLARSLGFTPEYLTPEQSAPGMGGSAPVSMRDRGMNQAGYFEAEAENLADTVRGLIGARPGEARFADRLALNMGTEELVDHYNSTMDQARGIREKAGRIRSAAEAIPQSLFIPRR